MWIKIQEIISLAADLTQIVFGLSTLYFAWTQREKISTAFTLLLNYSFQISLSDFKHWLKLLEESSVEDKEHPTKARIYLAHIAGKIRGNTSLYNKFGEKILKRINIMIQELDNGGKVTETSKISLVSELKEQLATIEIVSYNK